MKIQYKKEKLVRCTGFKNKQTKKTQIHSHGSLPDESVGVHNTLNEKQQFCCYLCQLGLVEAGPGLELVVSLVASQRVHLQLEKVHLKSPK